MLKWNQLPKNHYLDYTCRCLWERPLARFSIGAKKSTRFVASLTADSQTGTPKGCLCRGGSAK